MATARSWKTFHESPLTMLVPLGVLAAGALVAGAIFAHYFIGAMPAILARRGCGGFGHAAGRSAIVGRVCAVRRHADRLRRRLLLLHPQSGTSAQMAAKKGLVYTFLYNKWYFDELYAFLFVRPAMRIGRFLWKSATARSSTGSGPTAFRRACWTPARGAVRLQSGYVYHYAFAMLIGVVALTSYFVIEGGVP